MNYSLDATGKSLGRLATEAAALLQGKNDTDFVRNQVSGNTVTISNASKLKIAPERLIKKTYKRYSGYPGGLKEESMAHVVGKKGYREVLSIAIKGMLPDNKLKSIMMKNLVITE
jgi:large subunit ribosomal protein L13